MPTEIAYKSIPRIPPLSAKIDAFIPIDQDPDYKPKTADLNKIKNYVSIDSTGCETKAHLRDKNMPEPKILRPVPRSAPETLDDVSNFPQTELIPLPESIPYQEGSYRPASMPIIAGFYPINIYLYRGKKYDWCSCGHSWNQPFCNGQCKWIMTRNRPVSFNVSESGYYKMCNCKLSANAPFCHTGTHKLLYKWILKSHRGFFNVVGYGMMVTVAAYWGVNWYQ